MTMKWDEFSGTRRRGLLSRQDYGVEIGALMLRYYFGIEGCIVPIACCPYSDDAIFAFTLVGPPMPTARRNFMFSIMIVVCSQRSLRAATPDSPMWQIFIVMKCRRGLGNVSLQLLEERRRRKMN
ncbi:hypothetical protein B0H19DRAFT_1059201 [Mycena capillaripes]|nr:hypothetical protein B0H19DRAFT_1059201 [Mycena capillaripes]